MHKQPDDKFYNVTLRVEVTRRVIANSKEQAEERVDSSDMLHEIKNYKVEEQWIVEEDERADAPENKPSDYDYIEAIGESIVRDSYMSMRYLQERYDEIRKINQKLVKAGKEPREPFCFHQMSDMFLEKLRRTHQHR